MSLTGKKTSVYRVIENLFRDNGYQDVDFGDAIEWVGEALDLIGVPQTLEESLPTVIPIENWRGELPCDLVKIIQTLEHNTRAPMLYTTDRFHMVKRSPYHQEHSPDLYQDTKYTYKIDGKYIYPNFEKGEVDMVYLKFPVDEDGYPMIPEETRVIKAVEAYLQYKLDWKLLRQNKLPQAIYSESKRNWAFRVGSAKNKARIYDSPDEWQSFQNQFVRLIPTINQHQFAARHHNTQELRKLH